MKIFAALLASVLIVSSCHKELLPQPPKVPDSQFPQMLVTELYDVEVNEKQHQVLDIDKDGSTDIVFGTWLIGDPVEREDEILYHATTSTKSSLMIVGDNGSPRYNKNEIIPLNPPAGHAWYVVAMVEFALKNIGENIPPYWEKDWKDVNHKFLAIQVQRSGKLYNGWIELSMDTANSKLILHRCAIAEEANRAVKAGV